MQLALRLLSIRRRRRRCYCSRTVRERKREKERSCDLEEIFILYQDSTPKGWNRSHITFSLSLALLSVPLNILLLFSTNEDVNFQAVLDSGIFSFVGLVLIRSIENQGTLE